MDLEETMELLKLRREVMSLWKYVTDLRAELEASHAIKCLAPLGPGSIRCQLIKGHGGGLHDDLCQYRWYRDNPDTTPEATR